jgi:AraC family transcriptional regulator
MQAEIKTLPQKKLIGMRMKMSFAKNTTPELWRNFMTRRKEVIDITGSDLYSLQNYPPSFFNNFDPEQEFEKWAAIEVTDSVHIPRGMESFNLPGGLYATFLYRGPASAAAKTFQHIFQQWLPSFDYVLDDRPHFEILGAKFKHEDEHSEEELWIPVKFKTDNQ